MKYKSSIFLVQLLLLCNLSSITKAEENTNKNDCFMVLNSKKDLLNISEDKGDGTVEIHYPLVNKTFIGVVTLLPNENPKNSEDNKKICLKIQDEEDRNELKDLQNKIQDIIEKNNETEKSTTIEPSTTSNKSEEAFETTTEFIVTETTTIEDEITTEKMLESEKLNNPRSEIYFGLIVPILFILSVFLLLVIILTWDWKHDRRLYRHITHNPVVCEVERTPIDPNY